MRLFVGIPLAPAVIEELLTVSVRLQASGDGLRWSPPQSWHLTLQFLGNTPEYECIITRLHAIGSPSFCIQLEGLGFFDRAGIFFAGVDLSPELEALQQRVTAATGLCGFVPETRPYHPHITLARSKAKGTQGLKELKNRIHRPPEFTSYVAREFVLYESVRRPTGSEYIIRERFGLECATPL